MLILDLKIKTFVLYIPFIIRLVHLNQKTLIDNLKIEKVIVFIEYLDFVNVFSPNSAAKLPKHFKINNNFIDLKKDKRPSYKPN